MMMITMGPGQAGVCHFESVVAPSGAPRIDDIRYFLLQYKVTTDDFSPDEVLRFGVRMALD